MILAGKSLAGKKESYTLFLSFLFEKFNIIFRYFTIIEDDLLIQKLPLPARDFRDLEKFILEGSDRGFPPVSLVFPRGISFLGAVLYTHNLARSILVKN